MSAHQAEFPIRVMARVLRVSVSGFYAWRSRPASAHARADAVLLRRIRTIHVASHGTYGAPRVHAELQAEGTTIARKRVARLKSRYHSPATSITSRCVRERGGCAAARAAACFASISARA